MTVHSWGENPLGKWTLEIHNDAYTNWGNEAKFFRWSLKLYGTTFDPNSDNYDDVLPDDTDENLVGRRILIDSHYGHNHTERDGTPPTTPEPETTTTTATTTQTTTRPTPTRSEMRGCVSMTVNCTTNISQCRTFSHRNVAKIFCDCSPILCLGISSFKNEFNLQCSISKSPLKKNNSTSKHPFYCQFIPFFSYSKKRWRKRKLLLRRKKILPIYTTWLKDWGGQLYQNWNLTIVDFKRCQM